jgi:4-amino-4-deoxy-L-arabinose transferase-like glycosyltransferase
MAKDRSTPVVLLVGPLLLTAGLLFGTRLGCPLLEPEETRYAEIPRQMLLQGRFVEPVWHNAPYYHKPPLFYWLVMTSYRLCGVHDWAARLVPVLIAAGTVLLTFAWGSRAAGRWAGFLGALVLCLMPGFVYLGGLVTLDGLLGLCVTAALAAAHVAVAGPTLRRGWWVVSALACGLGVLSKGPVALVLVAVPVVFYRLVERAAIRPSVVAWLGYFAVVAAVAGPWYVAVTVCNPEAAAAFFWQHNILRFVAPTDHAKPLWFYLPRLLLGTLPWALLLVPLLRLLRRGGPEANAGAFSLARFCLLAPGWCVLFFSLSGCKRAGYVQPCLPPLALALGCYLADRLVSQSGRRALAAWATCAAAVLVLLVIGSTQWMPGYHRRFALRGQVRRHRDLSADPRLPVYCYPHRWDSVSFYLQRDNVHAYDPPHRGELLAALREQPAALVFVKCDHSLPELVRALPPALEFVPRGRKGSVVCAGVVRRKE